MAKFKRKERGIVLEFGTITYRIDPTDEKLANKLIKFGEKATNKEEIDKMSIDEQKQEMIDFYNSILGDNAYEKIKNEVFEGKELMFEELLDVGMFMLEEVNKYNNAVGKNSEIIKKLAATNK